LRLLSWSGRCRLGIELRLDCKEEAYKQFATEFIPNMSIIDVLILNCKQETCANSYILNFLASRVPRSADSLRKVNEPLLNFKDRKRLVLEFLRTNGPPRRSACRLGDHGEAAFA
jgi:hypothetical protein